MQSSANDEGQAEYVDKRASELSLVEYFYFSKDDIGGIKKFSEYFAEHYEVTQKASNADYLRLSGFEETDYVVLYKLKKGHISIEITLLNLKRFFTLGCFWFHETDRHPNATVWKSIITELKELHSSIADKSFMTLGESRFYIIFEPQIEHELKDAMQLIEDRDMLKARLTNSNLYHYPEEKLGTHRNFILKFDKDQSFNLLTHMFYKDLPSTDFRIQRLSRFAQLYKDQTDTAMMEKKEIDKSISVILHQQVAMPTNNEGKLALWETEISNLSSMYSKLSMDGSKIREAMTNMSTDLDHLRTGLENLSNKEDLAGDKIFQYYIDVYRESLQDLISKDAEVKYSIERAKAAIDLVQTQVELFRGAENVVIQQQTRELLGQNILLQEERMALQVAATFVEFVLVFYYFIGSWAAVLGHTEIEFIPWYGKLGIGLWFTSSVVLATHYIATIIKSRNFKNIGFLISLILLVGSIVAAAFVSMMFVSKGGGAGH